MFTPPNSNTPNPQSPRDKDEWIAILVALGVLGGTAGWILFGGLPPLQLGAINDDSANVERFESSLMTEPEESELPDTAAAGEAAGEVSATQELTTEEDTAETAASPTTSPSDLMTDREADASGSAVSTGSEESPQTSPVSPDSSVDVPPPRVPNDPASDVPVTRAPLVFSDVPDTHWAKVYIDALTARGILNGLPDGSYAPDRPMTRAELSVQVAQAFEVEPTQDPQLFTDIPQDYWAAATIDEAVATGFMKGYPNQVFQPNQTVPRVQVLVALSTGLSLPESPISAGTLQPYQDQSAIPEWARDKVAAALESGIITPPADGTAQLRPNAPATRAEVAAMLYHALTYMGKVEPIE
ncbi:MAG: S-layer homology domain-containing protein [Leptolyngbya sp. SIO1E4]|nr:S-layer homology domain-containing protein [Leptolyngbya sp. SIO1E4]